MFIAEAYAQAASEGLGGSLGALLPFALIIPIFYLLLWRPQQKKMKDHKALVAGVKRGDRVIAAGGLIGVISKVVDDSEVQIEVSDGVKIRILRSSISDVLNRTESAKGQDEAPAKPEKSEKKGEAR